MASIYKRGKTSWQVRWREGDSQRWRTFHDEADAYDWKFRLERGERPLEEPLPSETLKEFATAWLGRKRRLSESTRTQYKGWLRHHVYPELGDKRVQDISTRLLVSWRDRRLEQGAGPAVLGKAITLLGQIMSEAVAYGHLSHNPVTEVKRPEYRKREHRWLTAEEVEQIRLFFLDQGDQGSAALISVLAYIGVRPQDALALNWSDLDERLAVTKKNTGGQIEGGSKTGNAYRRTVFVPAIVQKELLEWREALGGDGLMFPNKAGGPWRKHDYNNWRRRSYAPAAERVRPGQSLRPYDLRHTAATLYVAAGYDHLEVAQQLGHTPEVSIRTYQHLYDIGRRGQGWTVNDYIRQARGMAPNVHN